MSDEHGDSWDPFTPTDGDGHEERDERPEREERPSPFSHPMMPWVVVAVVVLVVIGILVAGRSDDGSDVRATAPTVPAEEKPVNRCPGYELGTNLFGVPKVAAEPGVHIWHDMDGFHLRLVPIEGELESITGTVVGEGRPLTLVEPAPPGSADEDGTLTFELTADDPELVFKRSCETTAVTFDLLTDGVAVAAERVTIGNGEIPPAVPVVLQQLPS